MAVNITVGCIHLFNYMDVMVYMFGPIGLIAVVQNILTIVTIHRTAALHTVTNMIIVSMNIGNTFLIVSFLVIISIFYTGLINLSHSATYVDTFTLALFSFQQILTCLHFGVVAIDRYIYISQPFVYIKHVTRSCIITVIILCWAVAIIYLCVPLIVYRGDSYHQVCMILHPPIEYFSAIWFVYLAVLIIVFVCDFKIVRLAFLRKKSAIARRIATSSGSSLSESNFKATIRSVKFFAFNFGIFSLCTLPLGLITIVNYFMTVLDYMQAPVVAMYEMNYIVEFYVHIYTSKEFYLGLNRHICHILNNI